MSQMLTGVQIHIIRNKFETNDKIIPKKIAKKKKIKFAKNLKLKRVLPKIT